MKKMWMLLLVIALMTTVLAVPAMAVEKPYTGCECAKANNGTCVKGCPGGETVAWKAWDKTNALPTTEGNYYLTGPVTLTSTQKISTANQYIRLDLNGYTVQNDQNSRRIRIYQFAATGCTLVITDSVGSGSIKNTSNFDQGGIVLFQSAGTVKLFAGELDGTGYTSTGTHELGGCLIPVTYGSKFYMYGGVIRGCTLTETEVAANTSVSNGTTYTGHYPYAGPVLVNGSNAVFEMHGGIIYGGYVKGGNTGSVEVSGLGGAVSVKKGAMTMYGGTITGGTDESERNVSGNVYVGGTLNLHGGKVEGYVDASNAAAIHIYGGQIKGGTTNLNLGTKTLTVSSPLAKGTDVVISRSDAKENVIIAKDVTAYNGGIRYQNGVYALAHDTAANTLKLVTSNVVIVRNGVEYKYTDLAAAIGEAESGDYVRLMADYTGDIRFAGDLYLDLNGYDITGDITITDGVLYLLDSQTADYTVEDGRGYGTVTGTITGTVQRAFTTNAIKANYDDNNYRYVVVKDESGVYSAHRIYLTVKSVILYPQDPSLNYRTILRCDELVAGYINSEGGGYGVLIGRAGYSGYTHGNYRDRNRTVLPYAETEDGVVENNMISNLTKILSKGYSDDENQMLAQGQITARAYIWIPDAFYDVKLAEETTTSIRLENAQNINQYGVTSSSAVRSLKQMVNLADSNWDKLNTSQKLAMRSMYQTWKGLMTSGNGWTLDNVEKAEEVDNIRFGCLCGDPNSVDNPCADNGHIEFAWKKWESTTGLPAESGNYYLADNVTLKNTQPHVDAGVHINLNLCGHSISTNTGSSAQRVVRVTGILNMTNYAYEGETAVGPATVSGYCNATGDGGALLVHVGGNVSLYSGVTLKAQNSNRNIGGVAAVYGSLNIYGGNIAGAEVTGTGGAVHVFKGGQMYMNAGTITGGKAQQGDAIYAVGTVTIEGGTVENAGGTNDDNIYLTGTLNLSGGTIDGGVKVTSTNSTGASLNLSGTPKVGGSGILLDHGENGSGGWHPIHVALDLESLNNDEASVVLRYTRFAGDYASYLCLAKATDNWADHPYEKVARKVLRDYAGNNACEISYEKSGIYIRKSTGYSMKWTCICGANYDEAHVNGCNGFDVTYRAWNKINLPNEPGNWYLSYGEDSMSTNSAGVKYVPGVSVGVFSYDYYQRDGRYYKIFTMNAKNTAGEYMKNDAGKYVTVADYTKPDYAEIVNGNLTEQTVAYVTANGTEYTVEGAENAGIEVLKQYTVNVDLNGYVLEVGKTVRAFSFRGLTAPTGYESNSSCRQADLTLNLLDSSQDHTARLATYGVYTGVTANGEQTLYSNYGTQWQGKLIWMDSSYNKNDKLNISYVTLDASSTIAGSGLALYNDGGTATITNSTIIGGVSQSFLRGDNDNVATNSLYGGGAITVLSGGTVTINGGEVKNGTSIYRTVVHGNSGLTYEFGMGGGNIFVADGTLNLNGTSVTGGKALIHKETETFRLPSYSYGSGGGVYVLDGAVNISGDTKIMDNYTGLISGNPKVYSDSDRFYDYLDVRTCQINGNAPSNLFLGGNPMTLKNLTGQVHYSLIGTAGKWGQTSGYNLNAGGHVGTFATYTGTAPTTSSLICDDSGAPAFLLSGNKVCYPAKNGSGSALTGASVYLVGYGKASVQPSLNDLKAGLTMDNYGNIRNTADLYNGTYYNIIQDSAGYFRGWDTQCYATALATTDGEGDTVIIIALDGRSFTEDVSDQVKRMVSYATGVPMDNIAISSGHQHSIPAPTTNYKKNEDGTYQRDEHGKAIIESDYATTYYTGIVQAAVAAMADRAQATVKVGTLQTASQTTQYNFVRNVKVMNGTTFMGMLTDNHNDLFKSGNTWTMAGTLRDYTNLTVEYESQADTAMQLVQYLREGADTIVMANFQTHAHLGSNRDSSYVHSDVIGAFRHNLETLGGYKVLYFSGAGGDVNTTTHKSEDTSKYPWKDSDLASKATNDNALKSLERAAVWGESLATLANGFLGGDEMKPAGGNTNVEVKVDTVNCTLKTSDASLTAIANAIKIRNWKTGATIGSYNFSDKNVWLEFAGNYANEADRLYSSFDASNIRRSLLWAEADQTTYKMPVTAYAMGEIGFVAAPYEMFQKNGSDIKTRSEFDITIIATLANGNNSYIPSADGYANGGYSTDQARFESGTGEALVDKYVEMLNGLK